MDKPATRPLDKLHLTILKRIAKGSTIKHTPSGMFFFRQYGTCYGGFLLDELRQAGYLAEDNQVTAEGELWLLVNSQ